MNEQKRPNDAARSELLNLANCILRNEIDVLSGGAKMYVLLDELELADRAPFEFLWALRDDYSEVSELAGRHSDLANRKLQVQSELAEFYRVRVLEACQNIQNMFFDKDKS